jgi:hypothetical protein
LASVVCISLDSYMGATRGGGGGAELPLPLSVFTLAARMQATSMKRKTF